MSFSQGLSGLNAASQALDITGNNIANSQTVGFKAGSASFADIFSGTLVGMGVQVASVDQNFGDGTALEGGKLDMAIQGNGFFRLISGGGATLYSRNGHFHNDNKEGYIVNDQGMFLTGFPATGTPPAINQSMSPEKIRIDPAPMNAKASDTGNIEALLSGKMTQITGSSPDLSNSKTTCKIPLQVYDSMGGTHAVNVYFWKDNASNWRSLAAAEGKTPTSADFSGASTLHFDASGNVTGTPAVTYKETSVAGGAADINCKINLTGLQLDNSVTEPSVTSKVTNGYRRGNLTGYSVGDNGIVTASYSNGQTQTIAQVAMSSFVNPGGLTSTGHNCWSETPQSGQPITGAANTGTFGSIKGFALEGSNVDMGKEMVNLIAFQRFYQSNSQSIKTQSEILQSLTNLG